MAFIRQFQSTTEAESEFWSSVEYQIGTGLKRREQKWHSAQNAVQKLEMNKRFAEAAAILSQAHRRLASLHSLHHRHSAQKSHSTIPMTLWSQIRVSFKAAGRMLCPV